MRRVGQLAAIVCVVSLILPAPLLHADPAGRRAELEDGRVDAVAAWHELAAAEAPAERAQVARSLGRMMQPALLDVLLGLLKDPSAPVREAAIWALGQHGFLPAVCGREAELAAAVRPFLADPDDGLRAHAAEAVGKLAGPDAPAWIAGLLRDPAARVRVEAAAACFRWRQVLRLRGVQGDLPALPTPAVEGLLTLCADPDPEVRWRAVYTFTRLPEWRATGTMLERLRDPHPYARLFAARALALNKAVDAGADLAALQRDPEAAVRLEAVLALIALGRPDRLAADLAADPSVHVRAALASAGRTDLVAALEADPSPTVQAALLSGRVKSDRAAAKLAITLALVHADRRVREAAAEQAAGFGLDGLPLLEAALTDTDENVRAVALDGLGGIDDPRAFALITRSLAAPALAERGTAVDSLGKRKEPAAWALLQQTYADCSDRAWIEVREQIVDLTRERTEPDVNEFLRRVLTTDAAASVQGKAAAVLQQRGVTGLPTPPAPALTHSPHAGLVFARNPRVTLSTDRGDIVIECFPADAPVHVASFVGLVKAGFYDGLLFHRVVPNFVIQGGDPLGSGWGDGGFNLRAEINEQRYLRGTLGMPRSTGFDTGGCQLFLTHIPTPHLDGLYTVFGRVISGLDVVDRIERGDRIATARVQE